MVVAGPTHRREELGLVLTRGEGHVRGYLVVAAGGDRGFWGRRADGREVWWRRFVGRRGATEGWDCWGDGGKAKVEARRWQDDHAVK